MAWTSKYAFYNICYFETVQSIIWHNSYSACVKLCPQKQLDSYRPHEIGCALL